MTGNSTSPWPRRQQHLVAVLHMLEADHAVSVGAMRAALTANEHRRYRDELEATWPEPKGWEAVALTNFRRYVRLGDICEASASKLPQFGSRALRRHLLKREAEARYASAVEAATELIRSNSALLYLFDREIDDDLDLSMEGVVRVRGSAHEFANPVSVWELQDRVTTQRRHARASLDALEARYGVCELPAAPVCYITWP